MTEPETTPESEAREEESPVRPAAPGEIGSLLSGPEKSRFKDPELSEPELTGPEPTEQEVSEPKLRSYRWKEPRGPVNGSTRLALALLGVALGVAVAGARFVFPGSAPILRVESLWQPGLRDVRRGETALRQGDRAAALRWFNQAVTEGRTPRLEQAILDGIIDSASRQGAWSVDEQFSSLSLQRRGEDIDRVRLAQALMGEGKASAAVALLNNVLSHRLTKDSSRLAWVAHLLAERLLALVLAHNKSDLKRAESLARIGIGEALQQDLNPDLQGSLNDALAWVYYREALAATTPGDRATDLELARIYGETAIDDLPPGPDPALGATFLFHLSRIYAAEGDQASALRDERTALRLAPATVNALREEERQKDGR